MSESICKWVASESDWGDFFETTCGNTFQFTVDGVTENQFKYCPYCGGEIEPVDSEND